MDPIISIAEATEMRIIASCLVLAANILLYKEPIGIVRLKASR
jgi:hypothetical protein